MKINYKKLFALLFVLLAVLAFFVGCCYVIAYPEMVSTIAKKQLYDDIQSGNAEAIAYYNRVYVDRGVYLFGEAEQGDLLV